MDPRNRVSLIAPLMLLVVCGLSAQIATAQQYERRDSVTERIRSEVDAIGLPIGAMRLYPELGLELLQTDNVFADDEFVESDTATRLTPELRLRSDSERHRAELGANADITRYADFDTEDFEDARFWALGGVLFGSSEINAEIRLGNLHEARTSPDDVRGTELTQFDRLYYRLAYTLRPGRFFTRLDGSYQDLDFGDAPVPGGTIDNDDRDRATTDVGLRFGYEAGSPYGLFVEGRADTIEYDQTIDNDGFERSSDGLELRLGIQLEFTGTASGEFYGGYLEREYDDERFGTVSGPTYGGEIIWDVTRLTTLTFGGFRTIDTTTVVGAAGIMKSSLKLRADHELLRNLILSAELELATDDYEGVDREDDLLWGEIGARYLMNRYTRVHLGYRRQDRDVSPAESGGRAYEISEFYVGIVGQL